MRAAHQPQPFSASPRRKLFCRLHRQSSWIFATRGPKAECLFSGMDGDYCEVTGNFPSAAAGTFLTLTGEPSHFIPSLDSSNSGG